MRGLIPYEIEVKTITEAFEQYHLGKERRRLAQTELNFTSSRSHSIFQIRLVRAPLSSKTGDIHQDARHSCGNVYKKSIFEILTMYLNYFGPFLSIL